MWKLLCTHKEGALKLKINSISIWARAKCCIAFVSIRDVYMPTRRRSRVTEKYIKTELNSVINSNIRYVYISLVSIKFTFWKIEHFHRQNDIFTVKKLPQVISSPELMVKAGGYVRLQSYSNHLVFRYGYLTWLE